jgi:CheY-like chemotaxis protein/HPt (histidine-containing phosphotransfer) domain-containing protein
MAINLSITRRQLDKLGIACQVVEDSSEALELLKSGEYAVALVDIGMPTMNGIELTRRLRAAEQDRGTRTPVIALTANYGSEDDFERYRKAGMDGQLSKPVNLKDLASTLRRWLAPGKAASTKSSSDAAPPEAPSEGNRPPIDIRQFKEILGTDDAETIREMFDLFIELAPAELENLSTAVAARDAAGTREAAHRFRSAAANAAAGRLSELLQKMETEAQDGAWDGLQRDFKMVDEECAKVTQYMRADG